MEYIHQIWYQGVDLVPDKYTTYRNSIRDLHPNAIIVTWDNQSILKLLASKISCTL